jgi:hypothetical protein
MYPKLASALLSVAVALMALVMLGGCRTGTTADPHATAQQADGVHITFDYVGEDRHPWPIEGELLAVEADGLVLVAHPSPEESRDGARRTIARVSFEGIRELRMDGRQAAVEIPLPDADRLVLTRRARYPQGVDAGLLRHLLVAYQQDELVVLY